MDMKYKVLGMSCEGCQKKITAALNSIPGVESDVNLQNHTATIHSDQHVELSTLNETLKHAGNYQLAEEGKEASTEFIKPEDRISPSSVYYCPMECEGDKVYFEQGKRCPVCNMYLVPIEEKKEKQKTTSSADQYTCPMHPEIIQNEPGDCPICHMHLVKVENNHKSENGQHSSMMNMNMNTNHDHSHKHSNSVQDQNAGKYYCPMYCEGDKVYDSNVGCPVCGMDLVKIPEKKKETLWTCPMHPEIIKDEAGSCPICGMDLVPIITKDSQNAEDDTYKILRKKFWIAFAFTLPVFILSMFGMWIKWPFSATMEGWIQLVLSIPVIFYAGWFLMKRGWVSFKTWRLNMFSLIALGSAAAFIFSVIALIYPSILPHEFMHDGKMPLYFESVCVIITLVIMGQMLEAKAHQKTGKAIEELINLSPDTANLVSGNSEKKIPLSEVKVGDVLRVKPGEKVPVDGKIIEGNSSIDESMISGEPIPVEKKTDDKVTSGTINGSGSFQMKAEKVGDDTLLAQIIKMVNEASRSRAPIQKLADKISAIFVPIVIGISILTFILWSIFGGDNKLVYAFVNAVAVLIVACPCALGLATPMSMMVGIGKGAKSGVLIKNAEALEEMEKVNVLITDKTGTLTEGKPSLDSIKNIQGFDSNEILKLAAALNQNSEHPLSTAVMEKFKTLNIAAEKIDNFENISGKGVKGNINGEVVLSGNEALLNQFSISVPEDLKQEVVKQQDEAKTISYLAKDGQVLGFLSFSDKIKESSKKAISFLKSQNIDVMMMTGDNEHTAKAVANALGIQHYKANCLPEDKMQEIKKLQNSGKIVAMTGDGINDAPALAQANVGISMGTGSDAAIESSSITLVKGDIIGVAKARILSEKLLRNIKENLFFAFIYNALGIPVAAGLLYPFFGILLSPMIAAAAMSFSSVSVILNSLRLNNAKIDL